MAVAVPPRMSVRSSSVSRSMSSWAAATTCSYDAASRQTGQSEPNSSRPGPKTSSAWSTYGCRSATDHVVQFASVTSPESFAVTFSQCGQRGEPSGPRLPAAERDVGLGEMIEHEAAVHRASRPGGGVELVAADQQVVDEVAPGDLAQAGDHHRACEPVGVGLVLDEAADSDERRT